MINKTSNNNSTTTSTTTITIDPTICVIVLGDIGRSPRMQYHTYSLSKLYPNSTIQLVGYSGTTCFDIINQQNNINIISFTPYHIVLNNNNNIIVLYITALVKIITQIIQLFYILLFKIHKSNLYLVQTPPAIPTLFVIYIVSLIHNASVILDWHNLGYTLLENKFKDNKSIKTRLIIKISKIYESLFGKLLNTNNSLCVTHAMKQYLKSWSNINSITLYDKPPYHFKQLTIQQQHTLWMKLETNELYNNIQSIYQFFNITYTGSNSTLFTLVDETNDTIIKRSNRPAIIISSTSWTSDEDFNILLQSLILYDKISQQQTNIPKLLCIITGKGPLRLQFEQQIKQINFVNVYIITLFVSSSDYSLLLGSVDIGISLHSSSSNLDLPMKIVDMYGCYLPVCAINFTCLHELVENNMTGLVFNNTNELTQQLITLLKQFPHNTTQLDIMRNNIKQRYNDEKRWDYNWNNIVPSIINNALIQQYTYQRKRNKQYIVLIILLFVIIMYVLFNTKSVSIINNIIEL